MTERAINMSQNLLNAKHKKKYFPFCSYLCLQSKSADPTECQGKSIDLNRMEFQSKYSDMYKYKLTKFSAPLVLLRPLPYSWLPPELPPPSTSSNHPRSLRKRDSISGPPRFLSNSRHQKEDSEATKCGFKRCCLSQLVLFARHDSS